MNEGAKAAAGDVLWFIHADCYPHPDSIKTMKQALTNEDINGVCPVLDVFGIAP